MKKRILIAVVLLLALAAAFCLAACDEESFDIKNTLSYDQYMFYFGKTDDLELSVTGVNKEELFISDGKVGEKKDSVNISLRPLKPAMLNYEYSYVLTGESGSLQGNLQKDNFGVTFTAELQGAENIGKILSVAVTYGETTAEVALENAITEIDNVRALEIAAETFKEDIDAALSSGGFGRETYVKLVRNDHDPEGGYYWFVSFIADRDDYWAALIDSKTGEVISTRKSAASESEETVATNEIPV